MGGLRTYMPFTYATFLIASLSLAGIFPFAGFWSKDEILANAWGDNKLLWCRGDGRRLHDRVLHISSGLPDVRGRLQGRRTAAARRGRGCARHRPPHAARITVGDGGADARARGPCCPHGFRQLPDALGGSALPSAQWLPPASSLAALPKRNSTSCLAVSSVALGLLGIGTAYAIYQAKVVSAEELRKVWGPVATLVERKYYMDDLYEGPIVRDGLYNFACAACQWFDTHVIDFSVNGAGRLTRKAGQTLRWVQSGSFQAYGSVGFAGVVLATFLMLVLLER